MYRMRLLLAVAMLLMVSAVPSFPNWTKEEQIGRELAEEIEKDAKLVTDPEMVARVNRIGQAVAAVAGRDEVPATYGSSTLAGFSYQFKIVDRDEINAFSLPGGLIYVCKGLVNFVKSDDELAGVLAHEVAHAAHHHMTALLRKQSRMDLFVGLVAVIGSLSKMKGNDLANVLYGAQSVRVARMTGLGREAEFDADRAAVVYAHKAGFDARGILRFLDRLTSYQEQHGEMRNLGILQTHPRGEERSIRIARQLAAMGIDVDLREAAHLAVAQTEPAVIDGKSVWTVKVAGRLVCATADANGVSSRERAEQTKAAINALLREGLSPIEIKAVPGSSELTARGKVIVAVTAADSAISQVPAEAILARAADAIRYALWSDWIKKGR